MLGAPPPRRRAGAIRRTTSAGPGDAVEAPVRRAGIRRRVGPEARQPRLHAREAVGRIVATSKETDLLNTQEPREGDGVRLGMPRREVVGQEEGPPAVEALLPSRRLAGRPKFDFHTGGGPRPPCPAF